MRKFIYKFVLASAIWWAVVIGAILLSSCESQRAANKTAWLKRNGYMIDSTKTETKFIQGEIRLLKDTTYISSSDTLRSDSTTVITHHYYKEKHFYQKDTLIINNSKTIHVEREGTNVVPWWYWLILSGMGVVIFGLTFRK